MSFEQLLSRFPILLPGAAFFVLGLVFLLFPPKRINGFYGYRTERSRRDIESWNFAQRHSAKAMIWTSLANMAVCLCGDAIVRSLALPLARTATCDALIEVAAIVAQMAIVIASTERTLAKRERAGKADF